MARAAMQLIQARLAPFTGADPVGVVLEWNRVARQELGWDGRDNRVRMDQAMGPWEKPVDYVLRERKRG